MPAADRITNSKSWQVLVLVLILLTAFVERYLGNVDLRYVVPITISAIALATTSFSLQGNFWKPSWADADPGLNLVRSLIVLLLCVEALVLVHLSIEAWFGSLELHGMNRLLLKSAEGLAMIAYFSRKIANRSKL